MVGNSGGQGRQGYRIGQRLPNPDARNQINCSRLPNQCMFYIQMHLRAAGLFQQPAPRRRTWW